MHEKNIEKLSQLDLGSLSIGDLSNLKDSILRDSLIDIAELGEDELQLQSHQNHTSHASHVTHENSIADQGGPIM
jgi:hypothetical protein